MQPPSPIPPRYPCSFRSHFPERFVRIIALHNHPLATGACAMGVPSFQNNGGALWGVLWCHNFSSWQAGQENRAWGWAGAYGALTRTTQSIPECQGRWRSQCYKHPPNLLNHAPYTEQRTALTFKSGFPPPDWYPPSIFFLLDLFLFIPLSLFPVPPLTG